MKLLFDHNLSPSLVNLLRDLYPDSIHLYTLGLERVQDYVKLLIPTMRHDFRPFFGVTLLSTVLHQFVAFFNAKERGGKRRVTQSFFKRIRYEKSEYKLLILKSPDTFIPICIRWRLV
jgi:hypothetical protein